DLLAVEIAAEIEQMGFEHRLAAAEGRTRADIARGGIALAAHVDTHGIDAVAYVLAGGELEIERRKAEPLATTRARLHAAAHAPPIAELFSRLLRLAGAKMLADAARGEDRPFSPDRRDHVDAEAVRAAKVGEALGVAGPPLAEREIVPDHDVAGAEPI